LIVVVYDSSITQLPIHECKDWNLHVVGIKDQYCTIRYDIYNKWEFLIVTSSTIECFPDIRILTKIERTTEMNLIKTRKLQGGFVELRFGRPVEQKKLQQWIVDLINWSIYSRYRNLN
jgi:hypothetical protein